jgi:hypothetical protein
LLQTRLSNPHYKPEIAAQCTLVNFIVTEDGLEVGVCVCVCVARALCLRRTRTHITHPQDQLLGLVVNLEMPELEERRTGP